MWGRVSPPHRERIEGVDSTFSRKIFNVKMVIFVVSFKLALSFVSRKSAIYCFYIEHKIKLC